MKYFFPKTIKKGDTIGIVSPSEAPTLHNENLKNFHKGIKFLQNRGYKVKVGKNALKRYYYSAGTIKQRVSDIHDMFKDKSVKAIISSIGGDTGVELLPHLDYELIKNNPKIFMGISDATTYLLPITEKTGLITFYGPYLIYTFGSNICPEIGQQIFDCLEKGQIWFKEVRNLIDANKRKVSKKWTSWRDGQAKGILFGGYLEIVLSLIGIGELKNFKGKILFLESMESANIIHQRLAYLKIHGVFDQIEGLILGYFPDIYSDKKYYREIGEIVLELTKDKKFPILQVNELGHCIDNFVWPNGAEVEFQISKYPNIQISKGKV